MYSCADYTYGLPCCRRCYYNSSNSPPMTCIAVIYDTYFVYSDGKCYACDDSSKGILNCYVCNNTGNGSAPTCINCSSTQFFVKSNTCIRCSNTSDSGWVGCDTCSYNGFAASVSCLGVVNNYFFINASQDAISTNDYTYG